MRGIFSGAGVLAAIGIMIVSASMNARYAMSLGTVEADRYLLAAGALFADVGKALAWLYFTAAVMRRQALSAVTALVIFLPCLGIAVSGSFGYIATQRASAVGHATTRRDTLLALKEDARHKQARRTAIGAVEAVSVVTARLEAMQQNVLYARTKQGRRTPSPVGGVRCTIEQVRTQAGITRRDRRWRHRAAIGEGKCTGPEEHRQARARLHCPSLSLRRRARRDSVRLSFFSDPCSVIRLCPLWQFPWSSRWRW